MYPALLAILNNIAAYVQNLGRAPSSKLLRLFASMSSPSFLLANDNNHTLLHSLLEAINATVEHQYERQYRPIESPCPITDSFQIIRTWCMLSYGQRRSFKRYETSLLRVDKRRSSAR